MARRGRPSREAVLAGLDRAVQDLAKVGGLPLPAEARSIWTGIWYEQTHHSTAIEGNTLVLLQVKRLLEEGKAVGNKELREYLEVQWLCERGRVGLRAGGRARRMDRAQAAEPDRAPRGPSPSRRPCVATVPSVISIRRSLLDRSAVTTSRLLEGNEAAAVSRCTGARNDWIAAANRGPGDLHPMVHLASCTRSSSASIHSETATAGPAACYEPPARTARISAGGHPQGAARSLPERTRPSRQRRRGTALQRSSRGR